MKKWIAAGIAISSCFIITSCTDNKYDFDQVDKTVGVGGGELLIPSSSTDYIMLDDVLELNGSKSVVISDNGDYLFQEIGKDVAAAEPMVDEIVLVKRKITSNAINITLPSLLPGMLTNAMTVEVEADQIVHEFEYSDVCPEEVVMLSKAGVEADVSLKLNFSKSLQAIIPVIKELVIELPAYIKLDNIESNYKFSFVDGQLIFTDVPTSQSLLLNEQIVMLDLEAENKKLGKLEIAEDSVKASGMVRVAMKEDVNLANIAGIDINDLKIVSEMEISDIRLVEVTGKFAPVIDLDNLGNVDITGIPDFLTGGNVIVDLYNPQIVLNLDNNVDISAYISGTITAQKGGKVTSVVEVPEFYINANGKTSVCICRTADGVESSKYDKVLVVPSIGGLIKVIPDNISFSAVAKADSERISTLELGKKYSIKPSYEVNAPIAFAEDARIVYSDTINEWNKDVQDIELSEGAFVKVEANVESCIPAYLEASTVAIGLDGKDLEDIEVSISNGINASKDGVSVEKTPITVVLKQKVAGALKRLDGVRISIEGAAKSEEGKPTIVGQTLNAYKHSLKASDIKITLSGQVIVDMN